MKKRFSEYLKKIFPAVKDRTRLVIIFIILIILGFTYSRYVKAILCLIIFIAFGGVSKLYHRIFKSSIGVDLVFFTTIMISIVYRNLFLSLLNAWLGLIIADTLGQRFSHTSIVSLIGLTLISIAGVSLPFPLLLSAIILTIMFDIYSVLAYSLLGSSIDKIILYLITHIGFNLILIFSFAEGLSRLMV